MNASDPSQAHPVLATGIAVATTVVLHAAICTAVIGIVKPDVPDLVPYWLMSVLAPSGAWALLVIGRAAAWRRASSFWLGASAGIVVLLSFMTAFFLYVGPVFLRGVPLALIFSSWILFACAIVLGIALRVMGHHVDEPIDAGEQLWTPSSNAPAAKPVASAVAADEPQVDPA